MFPTPIPVCHCVTIDGCLNRNWVLMTEIERPSNLRTALSLVTVFIRAALASVISTVLGIAIRVRVARCSVVTLFSCSV